MKQIGTKATNHQNWIREKTGQPPVKEPDDLKGLNQVLEDVINDGGNLISKNEKELNKIKEDTKHDVQEVKRLAKLGFLTGSQFTGSDFQNRK